MKTFDVMVELKLMQTVQIEADDEAEAQQKAQEVFESRVGRMSRHDYDDYEIEVGDADEVIE